MDRGGRKERIITASGKMWSSTLISQIFAFFRGLIIPDLLHPQQYGILGGLNLFTRYAGYLDVGFLPAMERDVPMLTGSGDEEAVQRVKSTAFLVNLFTTFIYSLFLVVLAVLLKPTLSLQALWGFTAFIVLVIFGRLSDYYRFLFRGRGRFGAVSAMVVINSAATLLVIVPLVYFWRLYGFYAGAICVSIFVWVIFFIIRKERTILYFDRGEFWRMLKIGLPMFLMGIGGTVLMTLDRFFIIYYLTTTELGYYTISVTISMFVFLLPVNISKVLAQNLFLEYGKTQSEKTLRDYVSKTTAVISTALAVLIALASCFYPLVLYVFLNHYIPAMDATFLLLVAVFFLGVIIGPANTLIAQNRQLNIFFIQLVSILLTGLLCFLSSLMQMGIIGIAGSMVIGFAIYAVFVCIYTFRLISMPAKAVVAYILEIILPLAYSLSALYATVRLFPAPEVIGMATLVPHLTCFVYRLLFIVFLFLPMMWVLERRTGIFKDMRQLIERRRRGGERDDG